MGKAEREEIHANLPSLPGTYVLLLKAAACSKLAIGKLGEMLVQPGVYAYVGSAAGPGGLAARVGRHCRKEKRLRWHVDYLRSITEIAEIWYGTGKAHRECRWAKVLALLPGASTSMAKFGASDCRCPAHLFFFPACPSLDAFRHKLRGVGIDRLEKCGW